MLIMEQKPMLTPEQVAQRLNTTERKVYALLRTRELVGLRVGREWRIEQEELQAYIQRSKQR